MRNKLNKSKILTPILVLVVFAILIFPIVLSSNSNSIQTTSNNTTGQRDLKAATVMNKQIVDAGNSGMTSYAVTSDGDLYM